MSVLDSSHNLQQSSLPARIQWFIRLRWIAVLGVAVATSGAYYGMAIIEDAAPLYIVAGLMALFNIWANVDNAKNMAEDASPRGVRRSAYIQIGADLFFLTLLLHFAGGIENPFLLFYVFQVVISGILLSARESYLVALTAIALFGGMVFAEQTGVVSHHHLRCYPHGAFAYLGDVGTPLNGKATSPLHVPSFLGAFALTLLVLCYFTNSVVKALRESLRREQEEHLRNKSILENMGEGVVCFDSSAKVVSCNSAAKKFLNCERSGAASGCERCEGYDRPLNGKKVSDVVHDLCDGKSSRYSCEVQQNGMVLDNVLTPLANRSDRRAGCIWIIHDLSEMRKLQWEVLQHERTATVAEISACLAHDIGNLLDGTLNGLRILEREAGNADECKKWCREIAHRMEKLPPVLQELVNLARRKVFEKTSVSIPDVVSQALHLVNFRAQRRRVRCEYSAEADLPCAYGDATYLCMVVVNLLLNAFDAVSENGKVGVSARRSPTDEGMIEISVEDNGCGIPPGDFERIFDPFYTTKQHDKGTGLGLTIAVRIVSEHGGDIRVSSVPGRGSAFTVSLPICREPTLVRTTSVAHE